MGHARALMSLEDDAERSATRRSKIATRKWSVRRKTE